MGPTYHHMYSYKSEISYTHKEDNVKMEAETGVMRPYTKEYQRSATDEIVKKQVFSSSFHWLYSPVETLIHLSDTDCGFLTSRTVRQYISVVLSHPAFGHL